VVFGEPQDAASQLILVYSLRMNESLRVTGDTREHDIIQGRGDKLDRPIGLLEGNE
jgi:hypothetical protein